MLMTFVALILGLLTASAKASFDKLGNELTGFAIAAIHLDRSLRESGSETDPTRPLLRSYAAAGPGGIGPLWVAFAVRDGP